MRLPLLIGLLWLGSASAWPAEEPSGCDKFKWPIERERAALTAPDRVKLASGGELAALPSTGITLTLRPPGEAKLPSPPERAPKEGHVCRFCEFQEPAAQGRALYDQSFGRWLARCDAGWAFSETQGL